MARGIVLRGPFPVRRLILAVLLSGLVLAARGQNGGNPAAACLCLLFGDLCSSGITALTGGVCQPSTAASLQPAECLFLAGASGDSRCPPQSVSAPTPSASPSSPPAAVLGNPSAACLCLLYDLFCPLQLAGLTSGACLAGTSRSNQPSSCQILAAQSGDNRCAGESQGSSPSSSPIPSASSSPNPSASSSPIPSTSSSPSPSAFQSATPSTSGNPYVACLCLVADTSCPNVWAALTGGLCSPLTPRSLQSLPCRSLAAQSGDIRCLSSSPIPSASPSSSATPSPSQVAAPSPGTFCQPPGVPISACLCRVGLVACTGVCSNPSSWNCRFLASFTGSPSCPVPTDAPPADVATERRRKEIRDLSATERINLVNAIRTLQQTPSRVASEASQGYTIWDSFTVTHSNGAMNAHNTLAFLPWHREFLYRLETELQLVNPDVTLPWWDWTLDFAQPHLSPIFDSSLFGSADFGPIGSGQFQNLIVNHPSTHLVLRFMRSGFGGSSTEQFTDPTTMQLLVNNGTLTFDAFASTLEGFHAAPHNVIGGNVASGSAEAANFGETSGDLIFTSRSPNDPIFYMIHTGVDKFFRDRQAAFPSRAREYDVTNRESLSDSLSSLAGATVSDGFDEKCVIYEPSAQFASRMISPGIDTSTRQSSVASAISRAGLVDATTILEEVLYVPRADANIDSGAAVRARSLGQYAYFNELDPIAIFRGFRLGEEARILASKNVDIRAGLQAGRVRQPRLMLQSVAVNESAVKEIMKEVEKIEEERTLEYRRTIAKKPYQGIYFPGSAI